MTVISPPRNTLLQPSDWEADAVRRAPAGFRVALICMPFASARQPSIQIGLITAIAEQAGFDVDAYHFNLDLAAQLSPKLYEDFCDHRGYMTGEWLFSHAAFGPSAPRDEDAYFQGFPRELEWLGKLEKDRTFLVDLRRRILPDFIDKCLAAVDWSRYRVVGFSSVFQQNVASLALAQRIKQGHPQITIVFGGANMEGDMGIEYARAFPFIDYVISGEGDRAFPELLRNLAGNTPHPRLPGLVSLAPDSLPIGGQAPPIRDLDVSPSPNYRSYFQRVKELGLLPDYRETWMLPFESSRGCWWGEKHHCTFCGLNGLGMPFRAKNAQRVLQELSQLAREYQICSFEAVDNILDLHYLERLFGRIEDAKLDYRFFYEVKANLTRAQIKALYRGGVRSIQPGIESMSTHVLDLMRKGCTMLQNVCCLKWCHYYGIRASWNVLFGFPGETAQDYEQQLEVMRSIGHLEPPRGCGPIWLERFSPYYTDREKFPVSNIRPEASYSFVYPAHVNLDKAAYFFDYDMGDTLQPAAYEEIKALVLQWQENWRSEQRRKLTYRRTDGGLLVDYDWGPDRQGTYTLFGPLAVIYESCIETMHSVNHVVNVLRNSPEAYNFEADDVREAMDEFCRGRLMLSEAGKYLSLAIPSNPNW